MNTITFQRPVRYGPDFVGPPEWGTAGLVETVTVPAMWAICGLCRGHGNHVHPSIDCNGLTGEDFDEDPSFGPDYFSGVYDVPCNQCGGTGKELQPADETDSIEWLNQRANDRAEAAAERRLCAAENGDWESYCGAGDPRW